MKKYIILWSITMMSVVCVNAQSTLQIDDLKIEKKGSQVEVSFTATPELRKIRQNQTWVFTPVLYKENNRQEMPEIIYGSRRTELLAKRKKSSNTERHRKSDITTYTTVFDYKNWMNKSSFALLPSVSGCCKTEELAIQPVADNILEMEIVQPYRMQPHVAFIQPKAETIKNREVKSESNLDFAVGKTNIDPAFGKNPTELAKMCNMLEEIVNDQKSGTVLQNIVITGYASPEGSLATNQRLSEGRARSLQTYLTQHVNIPPHMYKVAFGGENWDGLVEIVKTSQMNTKDEVLSIIAVTQPDQTRKDRLMKLNGGAPYKYMLKEFYPGLRKVIVKANYSIKAFDLEEAKQVAKTRPQNLSLNEMFHVANSYAPGSDEFNELFETAVRMYPQDETANLNAAAAALNRGDLVSAEKFLSKKLSRSRVPEYDNSLGVLEILRGNYDKAEEALKAAAETGLGAAKANLDELNKKRENLRALEEQSKYE